MGVVHPGVHAVYITRGGGEGGGNLTKLHILNANEYMNLKFYTKRYLASKFPTPKKARLKYLNTDLFNQTPKHNFASVK